jgi:hypothetical protein
MTEDFKTKLLEYFTGNFQTGTTPYEIYQTNIETNVNNLYSTLSSEIGNQYTGEFFMTGVLQAKTPGNVQSNIHIMYGYSDGSSLHPYDFGFIVLIDDNFNILEILTEYSSGVIFGEFNCLNVDEDGYLYGIETKYNDTQKRFIMLNNPAIKLPTESYQVKIRRTYNLPNEINSNLYNLIKKRVGRANYLMVGLSNGKPTATNIEIIVGASNNWATYNYGGIQALNIVNCYDVDVSWAGGLYFDILALNADLSQTTVCRFYLNGSIIDYSNYGISYNNNEVFNITGKYGNNQEVIIGVITSDYSTYMKHEIIVYKRGTGNPPTTIYSKTGGYYGTNASMNDIQVNGLDVYYSEMIQTDVGEYNCEVGRIIINRNNVSILETFNQTATSGDRYFYNYLFVTKENNLYTFNMQVENTAYIVKQSFNLNDYNNGAVDNTKYFIPKSANLFNGNDLILSKELYNLSITDNITTATVEIPNMKLNSDTINAENLIGSTYQNLVEAGVEFTKNQYEVVDVNFINTLEIQNKNNETIQEVEGQNRLNDSVSRTTDYENAKMTRYRINYADDTTSINVNIWNKEKNFFRTTLSISVNKEIKSIDFISEDTQTNYTTIYPVLEVGKNYKIMQDVYIAPKEMPQLLYYNTDELYYNTDEIYY